MTDPLVQTTSQVLANTHGLRVQQQKEWGEIITGWETRNRYEITDSSGQTLFFAGEVDGSWFARAFLKAKRPFTLEVKDTLGMTALTVRRPWTWFFSRADIFDGNGVQLGTIQQRFAIFQRRYTLLDARGGEIGELHGPFFKPWTFKIRVSGAECGKISKKWSGLLKEAFSDADNFGVEFGPQIGPDLRTICLGATFLIDFVHFENKSS